MHYSINAASFQKAPGLERTLWDGRVFEVLLESHQLSAVPDRHMFSGAEYLCQESRTLQRSGRYPERYAEQLTNRLLGIAE